jgi:CHAT domain-containing protein/Tfp pilus assembly protein PilF
MLIAGLTLVAALGHAVAQERSDFVVVEEATTGSPGVMAGFMPGDQILTYDGRPISSPAAFHAADENTFRTESVAIRVQRGNETLTLTAPAGQLGLQVRPVMSAAALVLYEEGLSAQQARRTDEAVVKWTAAARAATDMGGAAAAAWLHGRVGEIHEGQRRWKEASTAHASAWALLKQDSDAAAQSRALAALGRCSQSLNDFPAALRWYEEAVQVDTAAGNEMWVAADRNSMGVITYSRGDLAGAHDHFVRSLSIRERLAPNSLDVAASLNNLGNVANTRGDQEAAHEFHSRSLAIKERLAPGLQTVATSLTNLGNVAQVRGDLRAALDYHSRALGLKEQLVPHSLSLATTLNSLGNVSQTRGDLTASQAYYSRSLSIRERLAPDSRDVASSLNNLGEVAHTRGDLDAAQAYHTRALGIRERLAPDSLVVAASLDNLGNVARRRGDLQAAVAYHRRALTIEERLAPNSMTVATTLHNLGDVAHDRGDRAAALDYASRALAIRERLAPDSLDVAVSLNSLGAVALAERRFSDALPLFTRAVRIVESQRWHVRSTEARALLLAEHVEPYTGLLRAYLALDDVPAAFAMAERAHARSLLEALAEARADIRQGVDPLLLERERLLQRQLNAEADRQTQVLGGAHTAEQAAAMSAQLQAVLVEYQELQARIRTESPRYGSLTEPQPVGLAEIQGQVLDAGSLLLEYVMDEASSYLFAVTRDAIQAYTLPGRATIDQAARRVYELLTARQPRHGETSTARRIRIAAADGEYPAAAAALARMVLGPVAGRLSNQRLLIVADGALQYVPFAALPAPEVGHKSPEDDRPLMIDHEIVSLPSASVMAVLRKELGGRPAAEKLVAVLADPVFDAQDPRLKRQPVATQGRAPLPAELERAVRSAGLADDRGALSRLPFTRDEADAILALAPARDSARALDFKASRATVTAAELGRYRIVHLATHGVLNTEHPELSGLVLSLVDDRGNAQDGFLRLHEVYNLRWPADLVVLSACQTALGAEIKGEGLVGLTRGFMYAGAERVLASLWNVNDSATAVFMTEFYQGLFTRRLTPAAALRAAQIEMWKRKSWRSPYFWAGFVLQGEWR